MKLSVAIIGAGPAGLSAALWLKNLGMTPLVIEKESITGGMQNFNFLENDWVLGQPKSTGLSVAKNFYQHIQQENISVRLNTHVSQIDRRQRQFILSFNQGEPIVVDAVILASGTRYVSKAILADVEGFAELDQQAIIEGPYTFLHMEQLESQHIAILGGGDNAFENALMLLERGHQVSIISRSQPKAQKKFIEAITTYQAATIYEHTEIAKFVSGNSQLNLQLVQCGKTLPSPLGVDRLHVLAGYQANSDHILEWVDSGLGVSLDCANDGFLRTDTAGRTNVAGLYAAGDICNTEFPCVVSAVASGALAAKTVSSDLS